MNLSGESIIKIINFYKIKIDDWIVVFDDMSMDF
jgi:peptidyl-tRNA hydrolase